MFLKTVLVKNVLFICYVFGQHLCNEGNVNAPFQRK